MKLFALAAVGMLAGSTAGLLHLASDGWTCPVRCASEGDGSSPPAATGAPTVPAASHAEVTDTPVRGRFLDARSAAVFAGPCHYNGEVGSQGRRALLAFQVEEGRWQGSDLSGVVLAAAVGSSVNLGEQGPRSAVVYVDQRLPAHERGAAVTWLEATQGERLGKVTRVVATPLALAFEPDGYRLEIPGVALVEGSALPDDACCSQPESVWYAPLAAGVEGRPLVGASSACRFEGAAGIDAWTYQDQNNALLGTFVVGAPAPAAGGCCPPAVARGE